MIYQDGNILPVRSNLKGMVWYLNGQRANMNKQNIIVQHGGFYAILASRNGFTTPVFVEVLGPK